MTHPEEPILGRRPGRGSFTAKKHDEIEQVTRPELPTAQQTAHRLLACGIPEHGTPDAAAAAAGAEYVLAHVFRSLSQWVGTAGCHALFARAITLSARDRPVLTGVRYLQAAPHMDHFADNARMYGSQAIAEATTAVLASIITMLAGFIGEDIAMSLLEEVPPRTAASDPETASDAVRYTAHGTAPHAGHGEAASS